MIANNLQPYRNTRDDLPFQFLGVPTLLRATADTTNGAFGLIEHPALPPYFRRFMLLAPILRLLSLNRIQLIVMGREGVA